MQRTPFLLIVVIVCFCSCIQKRYIYSNNPALTPVFKEKNDAFVNAFYHTNGKRTMEIDSSEVQSSTSNGVCLQAGYALTRHFGLAGGFSYMSEKTFYTDTYAGPFDTSNIRYKRTEFSIAGDYFFSTISKRAGMNIIAGLTTGNLKLTDNGKLAGADYARYFNANSFTAFIQPCVSAFNEIASLSFFLKYSYVSFLDIKTNYNQAELKAFGLSNISPFYTAEFGFKMTVDMGKLPIRFDGQFNYIYNYSGLLRLRRTNIALGLTYNLGKHFKK